MSKQYLDYSCLKHLCFNALFSTKTVCKPASIVSCNEPDIFSPVYKSRHAGNICISKTVRCSVNCEPVSTLINSDPVKSFVTCKIDCFSNVSMAKEFNSVNYCLVVLNIQ